jgi:hypothetical protein
MTKCNTEFITGECQGHLGKFDSCLTEYLYGLSLDGGEREAGSVEFHGHYTYLDMDEETGELDDGSTIRVPADHYIVETTPSGAVYTLTAAGDSTYDGEPTSWWANRFMDNEDLSHCQWLDQEDD